MHVTLIGTDGSNQERHDKLDCGRYGISKFHPNNRVNAHLAECRDVVMEEAFNLFGVEGKNEIKIILTGNSDKSSMEKIVDAHNELCSQFPLFEEVHIEEIILHYWDAIEGVDSSVHGCVITYPSTCYLDSIFLWEYTQKLRQNAFGKSSTDCIHMQEYRIGEKDFMDNYTKWIKKGKPLKYKTKYCTNLGQAEEFNPVPVFSPSRAGIFGIARALIRINSALVELQCLLDRDSTLRSTGTSAVAGHLLRNIFSEWRRLRRRNLNLNYIWGIYEKAGFLRISDPRKTMLDLNRKVKTILGDKEYAQTVRGWQ